MIDLWWINKFQSPPTERDGTDEGRIWRAMQAEHLLKKARALESFDADELDDMIESDPDLLRELLDAKQD